MVAFLVAVPLWVTTATPAHACSCAPTTLEAQIAAAELILIGTAETVEPIGEPIDPDPDLDLRSLAVSVAVEEYIKGSGPDRLVHVEPSPGIAACQLGSQVGITYLLFLASGENGRYQTSVCQGSGGFSADRIDQIRKILQAPAPTPTVGAFPDTGSASGGAAGSSHWPVLTTAAAGAGALLASVVLLTLRRREH